jgi:hypothetical protein
MRLINEEDRGDGGPGRALLTVKEVAVILQVPVKKVYALPIPRVALSKRRVRFMDEDVRAFIRRSRIA